MKLLQYLLERTEVRADDECWPWLRSFSSSGYGNAYWEGEYRSAHSLWWEIHSGQRVSGKSRDSLTLDHECGHGQHGCVNPNHLRLMTNEANARKENR